MKSLLLKLSSLVFLVTFVSCNDPGRGLEVRSTPTITAQEFAGALRAHDGVFGPDTKVVLDVDQTLRSQVPGQDDWFVIWDNVSNRYKAVNLQYIRAITYYDYTSNAKATASEFRKIEKSDPNDDSELYRGDNNGDAYEIVERLPDGHFFGTESKFTYEDEAQTTDVSLMAREKSQNKLITRAANVSYAYNLNIETSMSLVTLGIKVEKMLSRSSNNELTAEDQAALTADMQSLAGVTFADIQKASESEASKEEVLAKIAKKLGTSSSNLEQKLLPEVFGINL